MTPAEKQSVFRGLILNGLRHLARALDGFVSNQLDFAIADAFFGFEIILKALVFQRDWRQIFVEPEKADAAKLLRGECRTIGRAEAVTRLEELGVSLPREVAYFKILEQHRNKLVHYFHPGLETDSRRRRIAAELSSAWAALRSLRAVPEIATGLVAYAGEFDRLSGRLLVLDIYLDDETTRIRASRDDCGDLEECPACRRMTFDYGDCLLCGYSEPTHRELTQGAEHIGPVDCPRCGGLGSVVVSGSGARCTDADCGAWFEALHTCEYCSTPFAVIDERDVIDDENHAGVGSFQFGCDQCSGNLGHQFSKDD